MTTSAETVKLFVQDRDGTLTFEPRALGALVAARKRDIVEEQSFLDVHDLNVVARELNVALHVHTEVPDGYVAVDVGSDGNNCGIHCCISASEVLTGRPPRKAKDFEVEFHRGRIAEDLGRNRDHDALLNQFIVDYHEEKAGQDERSPRDRPSYEGDVANRTVKGHRQHVLTLMDRARDGKEVECVALPPRGGEQSGTGISEQAVAGGGTVTVLGDPRRLDDRVALLSDGDHFRLLVKRELPDAD